MTAGDNDATPQSGTADDSTHTPSTEVDSGHVKAAPVIKAFGGIRPMATKLGVPVSTVQGWKQRDAIPSSRMAEIEAAAKANDVVLEPVTEAEAVDAAPAAKPPPRTSSKVPPTGSVPATAAPAPPRQAGERRGGGLGMSVAVIALLISLGAAGGVFWLSQNQGNQEPVELTARVTAMEERLASLTTVADRVAVLEAAAPQGEGDLSNRLAALENALALAEAGFARDIESLRNDIETPAPAPTALPAAPAELDALRARIAALESLPTPNDPQQLARLESTLNDLAETQAVLGSQLADGAQAADLTAAETRIAALESDRAELARVDDSITDIEARLAAVTAADVVEPRALALVLALRQLRVAAVSGRPYAAELELAQRLAGATSPLAAPLATLEAAATDGLPTTPVLVAEFPTVARALLQTSLSADAAASTVDRFRARIANVVSVRRTDSPAADDTGIDAALARAEAALAADDLQAVLQAMAPHEAIAPPEAVAWLADVTQRAAADSAIAQVDAAAFDILSRAERE